MAYLEVKRAARDLALDKAVHYLARDPDKNLFVLLDFAERLAFDQEQKRKIRLLREHFKDNEQVREQARRLSKNPRMISKFMINWVGNGMLEGQRKRVEKAKELGVTVPSLILVDPTAACNLRCPGCWAQDYSKADSLEPELFDRILREAKELGIYWVVLSGGEPFAYPHLLDIISDHQDMAFMAYTNGTLIDEETARRMGEMANISPAFSLEGWEKETDARRGKGTFEKIGNSMALMRENGIYFGASVTATRENVDILFSDDYIDWLVEEGAVYMWSFHYVPVGRDSNTNLMLTSEQRKDLFYKVARLRSEKPILIADFWNDGEATQGCIAGGRLYFHINAAGDVEPCAFAHFATENIRKKSLEEVLQNPLFKAMQKRQPFSENYLMPCPIIDHPQILRDIVAESGAHPTHEDAENLIKGDIADELDKISSSWRKEAEKIKTNRVVKT